MNITLTEYGGIGLSVVFVICFCFLHDVIIKEDSGVKC